FRQDCVVIVLGVMLMAIKPIRIEILVLLLFTVSTCLSKTTLEGLEPFDRLDTVFTKMKTPDLIQARRMDDDEEDYAVLIYEQQGTTVILLTSHGDGLESMITWSPVLRTNDNLKVGDSRQLVISRRGLPEETIRKSAEMSQYWYWSQGICFGINNARDTVDHIFIFPPLTSPFTDEEVSIPLDMIDIEHQYKNAGQQSVIIAKVKNKASNPLYGIKAWITLMDERKKPVDLVVVNVGNLLPETTTAFKTNVPLRGEWAHYEVGLRATDTITPRAALKNGKIRLKLIERHRQLLQFIAPEKESMVLNVR
ncbi:MAG: hypothetical protein ACPL7O_06835, partial [Armatimonadota bacterium]